KLAPPSTKLGSRKCYRYGARWKFPCARRAEPTHSSRGARHAFLLDSRGMVGSDDHPLARHHRSLSRTQAVRRTHPRHHRPRSRAHRGPEAGKVATTPCHGSKSPTRGVAFGARSDVLVRLDNGTLSASGLRAHVLFEATHR